MSDKRGISARRQDRPAAGSGNRPAFVQSHACVLVVGEDWTIRAVSRNSEDFLFRAPRDLLGKTLVAIVSEDVAHGLRARAQVLSTADPVARMEGCTLLDGGRTRDVTVTRMGTDFYFEFELPARGPGMSADPEQIRRLARRTARCDDLEEAAQDVTRTLAALTGFLRVSIHRIGRSGLGPALGCAGTHPLSAAPDRATLQAHADVFGPHIQIVPDVSDIDACGFVAAPDTVPPAPAEIRGLGSAGVGAALGEVLHRANVRAAMTIPIRIGVDLWGVILCHNDMPIRPAVGDRGALSLFSHLLGYEIGRLEHGLADRARTAATTLRQTMSAEIARRPDLPAALRSVDDALAGLIAHDGRLLWQAGTYDATGRTVTRTEFEAIFGELHHMNLRDLRAFDNLGEITGAIRSLDPRGTAVMVLPLSPTDSDCLLLFRGPGPDEDRARAWEAWEIAAGQALRAALVELQLQLRERSGDLRGRRQERQGLMVAELNHRTRNILNLIQGLVAQGIGDADTIQGYADVLESRILAIARAHDDLMEHDWGRVGLQVLLERELAEVLASQSAHGPVARISGDPIDLSPTAFTTMALVLHELARNAREHGALSCPSGRIDIDMSLGEDGFARLVWRESGGPSVRRPGRHGFGRKVIEHSVPHELRGKAEIALGPDGLVARFALPPGHFTLLRPDPEPVASARNRQDANSDEITIDGAALILDDSLIIAIESEDLLRAAGASEVYACNSVDSALAALDRGDVTFALLDVNLGNETSLPVAEQLWIDGIPAALATGYGANEDLLNEFPPLPVLSKPYTVEEIKEVLRHFSKRDRA